MVRPKLKLTWPDSWMGGTDSQEAGPELMMPSVPGPVTKPRLESETGESVGWPLVEATYAFRADEDGEPAHYEVTIRGPGMSFQVKPE